MRLYHDDPFGQPFTARVAAHGRHAGRDSLLLDQTGFYPESGGQLADRGLIAGLAVTDVQVDASDTIHHFLDGALPPVGAEVRGEPDRRRRRVHMALHTGQHMLSRALVDVAGAETISSRLGESACTIDVSSTIAELELSRAESLVNSVIDDDVAIRAWFPDAAALAGLPLRRAPKVTENVRVVQVGEFDCSPCGGTHCTRSAQVGFVRVEGLERYKGGMRVTFTAGGRARDTLFSAHTALASLARNLTCGPNDVPASIDRLRQELSVSRASEARMEESLVQKIAERLIASGTSRFVLSFPGESQSFLRLLARRLCTAPGTVALLAAPSAEGTRVVAARGPGSDFDCGAFVKRVVARSNGRGGGRLDNGEGMISGELTESWESLAT